MPADTETDTFKKLWVDLEALLPVQEGDLRIWWVPQVPMRPFRVRVDNLREAKLLLDTLASYDIFQLAHRIKPDFCNAGGVDVFEDGEWMDWEHPESGESFDEYIRRTSEDCE